MFRLASLLLLAMTLRDCRPLTLVPSTTRISHSGTANFTLSCTAANNDKSAVNAVVELHRLRLTKFEGGEWATVAEIDSDWASPKMKDGPHASGRIEGCAPGSSYLRVTWDLATNATSGEYVCDAIGYSGSGQPLVDRSLAVFIDAEMPLSVYDLHDIVRDLGARVGRVEGDVRGLQGEVDETSRFQEVLGESVYEVWPQGKYALIQPNTGCPVNTGVKWLSSYRGHHTESQSRNKDHTSDSAHMKTPITATGTKKYMYQRFCSVTEASISGLWPAGSYCIMSYAGSSCPNGFQTGYIYWDDEDSSNNNHHHGTLPTTELSSNTKINYCCRNDGLPTTAISLPTAKPFYLHRYGGECQQVRGMNGTEEFMFFDTQCCGSKFDGFTPDGRESLPDVKLELCYYAPNNKDGI